MSPMDRTCTLFGARSTWMAASPYRLPEHTDCMLSLPTRMVARTSSWKPVIRVSMIRNAGEDYGEPGKTSIHLALV
jgi:hypothetical protein